LRVWGGGLIERDAFYEHCDRLGILVWQEFSQSSSLLDNRPSADPEFVEMLEAEARAIVPRLRNHPSLALWCGGNELSDTGGRPLDESEPALAALGAVVRELDPDRLFLPTSPSGPEFGNTLELIRTAPDSMHDVHGPWEHQGLEGQHTLWNAATSLLNSEFACEGMPNLWTFRRYVTEELWPATKDNPAWAHRGDWFINEAVVQRCFGGVSGVEELARASQYLQAHGLRVALEANRRRRPRNSGSIVWHFNEPFPAGYSTSIVDYDTHPKPAYYAVARAYVPLLVAATLPATAWTGEREFEAEPWVSSFEGAGEGLLSVRLLGVDGRVLASCEHKVRWPDEGMGSAERVRYAPAAIPEGLFLFDLRLDERAAARYLLVRGPDLGPMLRVPKTVLRARSLASGVVLSNAGATAAIEVRLREPVPAPTALVADSGFTLLPGESRQVHIYWPAGRGVLLAEAWNAETVQIS
jgi:beta-mannosidase